MNVGPQFHSGFLGITRASFDSLFVRADLARVMRVSAQLQAGIGGVNEGAISTELARFGGVKESGYGREGSMCGIDEYLQMAELAGLMDAGKVPASMIN